MTDQAAFDNDFSTSSLTQPTSIVPRRRAAVACRVCNLRKVRCNVAAVGKPCANCAADGVECEILPRKTKRQPRASSVEQQSTPTTSHQGSRLDDAPSPQVYPQQQQYSTYAASPPAALDFSNVLSKKRESFYYSGPHHRQTLDQADSDPNSDCLPAARYLVSYSTRRLKREEDDAFLRAKGIFVLPSPNVYDQLVLSFFLYVFPFVPVLDASNFLQVYTTLGRSAPSVLLLWSMFVAAANHIGIEVVQEAGYESRVEMKTRFFEKAKIAFDQEVEENPITILQSVTILGFGVLNLRDQFDDWHWLGVAISMCLNLGLHRSPKPGTMTTSSAENLAQRNLRIRIWWSCVVRDRFLALIRSRPVRINLEDTDIPIPNGIQELYQELSAVPESLRAKFLPFDLHELGNQWARWVRSGIILEKIMRFRAGRTAADRVIDIENDLLAISPPNSATTETWQLCQQVIDLEVKLVHGALVILSHQHIVLKAALASQPTDLDARASQAIHQSAEAASLMDKAVQEFMRLELFRKMMPMFVTMFIPAMQLHLLDSRSTKQVQRRLGNHNLDLYMMILSELKDDYWGAELLFQIFEHARSQPLPNPVAHEHAGLTNQMGTAPSSSASTTSVASVGLNENSDIFGPGFGLDDPDGIFSSLFDNFDLSSFLRDG